MNRRRFPGINPFQTDEQDRFFGRDSDTRDLSALIALEKVVVLFGKSGHGKSSLLNAGLVPQFLREPLGSERRYEPLVIKFGAYVADKTPPAEAARSFLTQRFPPVEQAPDLSIDSLWALAKRSGQRRIVLFFDQFEEFFTYPLAQQERFADEVGELLHTGLPVSIAARFTQLPEETQDFLADKLDVKAVFAIREDRLHLLDKLKYPLPAIFARRYPLLALPRTQAREALENPARLNDPGFDTAPFGFSSDAMGSILDFLADQEGRVETNQLQILAESFEKRAETERINQFNPDNLGALKKIVADYYHEKIAALPDDISRTAAQRLCEEGLAQEGDPPMRLNLHEAQIRQFYGIAPALLDQLVNSRLLRAEPGTGGGYTYELPHDTLLEPVLEAKRSRLEADAKTTAAAAEQRAREAETLAAAESRRAEEAERLRRQAVQAKRRAQRMMFAAIGMACLAGLGLLAASYAYNQSEQQREAADQAKNAALESDEMAQIDKRNALLALGEAHKSDSLAQIEKDKALALKAYADQKAAEAKTAAAEAQRLKIAADQAQAQTAIALAQAEREIQKTRQLEITRYIASARRMVNLGKTGFARQILTEALRLDPENAEAGDMLQKLPEDQ